MQNWRLQLGYDLGARTTRNLASQELSAGQPAGDEVAVSDGIGHGEIDLHASSEK